MILSPDALVEAFKAACRMELEALKPGNVHVFAAGHDMSIADFFRSADAAAEPLCAQGARVGFRVLEAVEATQRAVGKNTNLGIILLCAPLAAAAETPELERGIVRVLRDLDQADAALAFRAIVQASPGGLGRAERHDVHQPATVTLREAMAEAADRDRVASQYTSDFADIFKVGLPFLRQQIGRGFSLPWATTTLFLEFLKSFPDSHILRWHGAAIAHEVRERAAELSDCCRQASGPEKAWSALLRFDSELKARQINPGTSADLTVATLFAHQITSVLPPTRNND